jgi:AraC-like DNA-binding protein/mannose-6-phosphate isomerase-like protein (cupin superfamily)
MPKDLRIRTYDVPAFREKYMQPDKALNKMLKADAAKFFIVKVEELFRLIKLPVQPSRSPAHTFLYITEGEAIMSVGTATYKVKKDECLFVPAGTVFSFSSPDVNKGFLLHFHNDLLIGKLVKKDLLSDYEFLQVWGHPHIKLGKATSACVLHICKRLYTEYQSHGLAHTELVHAYLLALLAELCRVHQPNVAEKRVSAQSITNKFKALVFADCANLRRVSDYAERLHISPNHLNKSVKAITGKSPTRWIDEATVLEAKVLLVQSDLSISEIAATVGLADASYFSRLFKKYEGTTPLGFRKRIEKS